MAWCIIYKVGINENKNKRNVSVKGMWAYLLSLT